MVRMPAINILLLSSEPVARLAMREVLERAGYTVTATGNLGTAVDRMQQCRPDLLMISPYVENITGNDAAKYLRRRCPGMRVLMVAGLLADDRFQNRETVEEVEVFPRPFQDAELLKKVKEVLGGG